MMSVFGAKKHGRKPVLPPKLGVADEANSDEAQANSDKATHDKPIAEAARPEAWNLLTWAQSIGVHEVVVSALRQDGVADLDVVRGLKSREKLKRLLLNKAVLEALVDSVWKEVQVLQVAGVPNDIANKFAGAIELSYSGLDTFFEGLEGVLGAPSPKIYESLATEHLDGADSLNTFVTDNYGIATTSKIEWLFVTAEDSALQQQGLSSWPSESAEKLPDRSLCRKSLPLTDIQTAAEVRNEQLQSAGHLPLMNEELVAARLYTGPMFVKYNAILRGLLSTSEFLRGKMISLCCCTSTADEYTAGSISFEEAKSSLNTYTTTLHGINSAVIKLGKLTIASKVYRGISGMALPQQFWECNKFGIKGGVENAFMSTTLDSHVAMGYARGDHSRMGIVIEVQQGMVSRGADISWLSQYPHECEILFGPLTGIEVLSTRIDGSVVVVQCAFNVNHVNLTLEQVLHKRHRLVNEMSQNIVLEVPAALAGTGLETKDFVAGLKLELKSKVLDKEPEYFNDDTAFVDSVSLMLRIKSDAVGVEKVLEAMQKTLDPAALAQYASAAIDKLKHDDESVRAAAVDTLGKLRKNDLARICRECSVVELLAHTNLLVRVAAAEVLACLDKRDLIDWAPALMRLVGGPAEGPECAALSALHMLAPADLLVFADLIYSRMVDAEAPMEVRAHCAKTLSRLDDQAQLDRCAPDAIPLANWDDADQATGSRIRNTARPLLRQAPAALLRAFRDPDSEIRFRALHTLHTLKLSQNGISHAQWLEGVLERLEVDDDWAVRKKAVEVIKDITKEEPSLVEPYIGAVLRSLDDSRFEVRQLAARFLKYLPPEQIPLHLGSIAPCLESVTDAVRYHGLAAIEGLEPSLRSQLQRNVQRLLDDEDADIRAKAQQVLDSWCV